MNMKDMIQRMTDIENNKGKKQLKKQLKESTVAEECGMPMSSAPMEQQGNPVTMSISLNASGKEHVADLINMMKNAGLQAAGPVATDPIANPDSPQHLLPPPESYPTLMLPADTNF